LHDITAPSNNRRGVLSSPIRFRGVVEKDDNPSTFPRDLKRRKLLHTPEPSPQHANEDLKGRRDFEVPQDDDEDDLQYIQSSPCERAANLDKIEEAEEESLQPLGRIIPIDQRGLGGRLLQSMVGLPTRSRRQHHVYPVNGNITLTLKEEIELIGIKTGKMKLPLSTADRQMCISVWVLRGLNV
jgi:hypothetical protein